MTNSVTMNVQLPEAVRDRLETLAKSSNRSPATLAAEAITAYVEASTWQVALIAERVEELEAGSKTVSHEEVARWVASWATGNESLPPKPSS